MRNPFIDENSLVQTDCDVENASANGHVHHKSVEHDDKCSHHSHIHEHRKCNNERKDVRHPWYKAKPDKHNLQTRFVLVLIVTIVFSIIQLVISYVAGSLSLINDAFHQMIDATGIIVCIFALRYANQKANSKFTYGYHRLEIIGAILCNIVLICIMIFLVLESVERIENFKSEVNQGTEKMSPGLMMIGATLSMVSSAWIIYLLRSRQDVMELYTAHEKCGCH